MESGVSFRPQAGTVRTPQQKLIGMRDYNLCPASVCVYVTADSGDREKACYWGEREWCIHIFCFSFVTRHVFLPVIYTHINLWTREPNRDGRWSRKLWAFSCSSVAFQSVRTQNAQTYHSLSPRHLTHHLSLTILLLAGQNRCVRVGGNRKSRKYPGTNLSSVFVRFLCVFAKSTNSMRVSCWCISWI